jgi:hypothetical protein
MRIRLFILLFFGLATACREQFIREIDFQSNPKLAVSSFITAGDTLIQVQLSKSVPVYQRSSDVQTNITDAVVSISGNGRSVNLTYDTESRLYQISIDSFFVVEGETYTLRVTHNNEQVEATTTVPRRFNLQGSATISQLNRSSFGYSQLYYGCQFNFSGNPAPQAYYGLSFQLMLVSNGVERSNGYYSNESFSLTKMDYYKANQPNQSMLAILKEKVPQYNAASNDSSFFRIHLWQADEAFYEFNRTADLNYRSSDEFFSEPVPIYSNVKGGLGCFGSYLRYSFNSPKF